jgi:glycosyltransferase involved in cell wall biosynthesis
MRAIAFNGKFRAGKHNGVWRVADRLIAEVDDLLAAMPLADRPDVRLVMPAGCSSAPTYRVIAIQQDDRPASPSWEQRRLPWLVRGALLVNLANLAPVLHWPKVTMLHDAQFCRPDCSYPWRQRAGYRLLAPLMARSSRLVLTVSDYSRRDLAGYGVIGRGRVEILHNGADHILELGADPHALARLRLKPQGYWLMFGSVKAYKNNAVVFEALRRRAMQGTGSPRPLVIVGPGRAALVAAGLSAPSDAVFAGPCDDATLRALYEGAQALLFPSRTEGFGLPPVEAMMCGCPVIAAPCGAVPEVCGDAALIASPDEPDAWLDQLDALEDPAVRAAVIATGRERASRYTWRSAGQALLGLLIDAARQ